MSLNINGYISQDSINLKELEKEIKDFFNYEGEIISEKSGEAILLSNFIHNNEFVCYYVNKDIGQSNTKTKEIIIKDKVNIGSVVLLIFLLVMSIAGFSGYFESNEEKSIGALFVGIIFGCVFILLFPYLTFKRPFSKLNSDGIFLYRGFLSKYKTFISWNRLEALIGHDKVFTIDGKEIQENELNAGSISKLDKFNGFTPDDYEYEAEWLEYLSTKKENNIEPEIYEIGSCLSNYKKDIETIKKM